MATTRKTGNLTDAISYRDDSAGASLRPCALARVAVDNQYCLSHSGSTWQAPLAKKRYRSVAPVKSLPLHTYALCLFFFLPLLFYWEKWQLASCETHYYVLTYTVSNKYLICIRDTTIYISARLMLSFDFYEQADDSRGAIYVIYPTSCAFDCGTELYKGRIRAAISQFSHFSRQPHIFSWIRATWQM